MGRAWFAGNNDIDDKQWDWIGCIGRGHGSLDKCMAYKNICKFGHGYGFYIYKIESQDIASLTTWLRNYGFHTIFYDIQAVHVDH